MTRRLTIFFLLISTASLAAAQVRPTGVRVRDDVMEGMLLKKVPPAYPLLALQARIQGTVLLEVAINKSGDVDHVQLISGHPMLAQSAIDAVKQWKYKPYLLNGEPVDVKTQVKVNFTLATKSSATAPPDAAGAQPGGIAGAVDSDKSLSAPPERIRLSENAEAGLLVTKVPPVYPQDAKDQHVQGTVVMKMIVAKDGTVANLEVLSGEPILAQPSLDAVRQWKYKPFLLNGQPLEVETQVHVTYTLAD